MNFRHKNAMRESFIIVGETCPNVDAAMDHATNLIKRETERLRDALTEAIERYMDAESKLEDAEDEIRSLKDEVNGLLEQIEDLQGER